MMPNLRVAHMRVGGTHACGCNGVVQSTSWQCNASGGVAKQERQVQQKGTTQCNVGCSASACVCLRECVGVSHATQPQVTRSIANLSSIEHIGYVTTRLWPCGCTASAPHTPALLTATPSTIPRSARAACADVSNSHTKVNVADDSRLRAW